MKIPYSRTRHDICRIVGLNQCHCNKRYFLPEKFLPIYQVLEDKAVCLATNSTLFPHLLAINPHKVEVGATVILVWIGEIRFKAVKSRNMAREWENINLGPCSLMPISSILLVVGLTLHHLRELDSLLELITVIWCQVMNTYPKKFSMAESEWTLDSKC